VYQQKPTALELKSEAGRRKTFEAWPVPFIDKIFLQPSDFITQTGIMYFVAPFVAWNYAT